MSAHHTQLEPLLSKLFDGALGDDDRAALAGLLVDEETRQEYLAMIATHAAVREELATNIATVKTSVEVADLPESDHVSRWRTVREAIVDRFNNNLAVSLLVAGLFCTVMVLSLAMIIVPQWQAIPASVADPVEVARISDTRQAVWSERSDGNFENQYLLNDDLLVLESGVAEVTFDNGSVILLEGPCECLVQTARTVELAGGRLTAIVPGKAIRFSVSTPTAEIVDLGTEFGVAVEPDGSSLVHVFDGLVEVAAREDVEPRRLTTGGSLMIAATGLFAATDSSDHVARFVRASQFRQMSPDGVLAHALRDYRQLIAGATTRHNDQPGLPASDGGYWNYYQSARLSPSDAEADLRLLTFGPAGSTQALMYRDATGDYGMPAVSAQRIFDSPEDGVPSRGELAIHPGSQANGFAVLRWTAGDNVPDVIRIQGRVRILGSATVTDGVVFALFANGQQLLERRIAAAENKGFAFDEQVSITPGQPIDFAIGRNGGFENDQTGFTAMITAGEGGELQNVPP